MLKQYKAFFAGLTKREVVAHLVASTVCGALFFTLGWYLCDFTRLVFRGLLP